MNSLFAGEATLHYGSSDFTIMEPGGYVICAVTGEQISLDHLRYWSHDRQEAYKDAEASLKAWREANIK